MVNFVKTHRPLIALLAVCLLLLSLGPAQTAETATPKSLGEFGDWSTYQTVDGGRKTCFMTSEPRSSKGNYTKRGKVFAFVTHRPAEDVKDEFSITTGYTYKSKSTVTVSIDGKNHKLFTNKDAAWAKDQKTDQAITKAMIKGRNMVVKGTSARGTLTTDTFSLSGVSKAYQAISKACSN